MSNTTKPHLKWFENMPYVYVIVYGASAAKNIDTELENAAIVDNFKHG